MSRKTLFFEIYNELTVLVLSYLSINFVEIAIDSDVKNNIGWVMVGMVIFNIAINFGSLFKTVQKNSYN